MPMAMGRGKVTGRPSPMVASFPQRSMVCVITETIIALEFSKAKDQSLI